jgi:hypothetical protein
VKITQRHGEKAALRLYTFEHEWTAISLKGAELMKNDSPDPGIEISTWIASPPEEIWNYLSDVSNDPQWRDSMIEAKWVSDPPYGVGSSGLNVVEGVGDWPWKITEWKEHRSASWVVTGSRFVGSQGGYSIEPEDAGSRITLLAQFNPTTFMRIFMVIMKGRIRREFAADLEKLKAIMEE